MDETPWVVKGVKEWLWIFACPQLPLFHAADTRSRSELETILGKSYNGVLGNQFVNLIDEALKNYSYFQQNQNLFEFLNWGTEFKAKVKFHLSQWIAKSGGEALKLLRSLRDKAHQWWYFLDHPEVPPDNNLAERTLRLAVTKRKVSGGSRSMERFQDTANLLTVVQTCRRQGRSVIEFFEQAILAVVDPCMPTPSLIP